VYSCLGEGADDVFLVGLYVESFHHVRTLRRHAAQADLRPGQSQGHGHRGRHDKVSNCSVSDNCAAAKSSAGLYECDVTNDRLSEINIAETSEVSHVCRQHSYILSQSRGASVCTEYRNSLSTLATIVHEFGDCRKKNGDCRRIRRL